MMVTFLLLGGIVPGSRNCLQVMDEIHESRSPTSVSGFMFSLTMRLPDGNFLHELKSCSPPSSGTPVLVVTGAAAGTPGVVCAGRVAPPSASNPATTAAPPT